MAWIKMIEEDGATGELKEFYGLLRQKMGGAPNIIKINSLNVPLLQHQSHYFTALMYGHSSLSRMRREMIALVVSAKNHCHY